MSIKSFAAAVSLALLQFVPAYGKMPSGHKPAAVIDGKVCVRPDASFAAFLKRFKTDPTFRRTRFILPLRYTEQGPGEVSTKFLSLEQLKIYEASLIVADPAVTNTGDRETDVCEDPPHVTGNAATFIQYTCHSDLHAETFHFVRRRGCWFLKDLERAGG
jgi:hypothetical protein